MSQSDYDQIRKRITDRYNNRMAFFSHFVAFLVSNGFGWFLWFNTPVFDRSGILTVLLLLISGGWLIGMSIHTIIYLVTEARERAIDRAIQEERAWSSGEKPKRDPHFRLSEDGEIEESTDDEPELPRRQRR